MTAMEIIRSRVFACVFIYNHNASRAFCTYRVKDNEAGLGSKFWRICRFCSRDFVAQPAQEQVLLRSTKETDSGEEASSVSCCFHGQVYLRGKQCSVRKCKKYAINWSCNILISYWYDCGFTWPFFSTLYIHTCFSTAIMFSFERNLIQVLSKTIFFYSLTWKHLLFCGLCIYVYILTFNWYVERKHELNTSPILV